MEESQIRLSKERRAEAGWWEGGPPRTGHQDLHKAGSFVLGNKELLSTAAANRVNPNLNP